MWTKAYIQFDPNFQAETYPQKSIIYYNRNQKAWGIGVDFQSIAKMELRHIWVEFQQEWSYCLLRLYHNRLGEIQYL